MDEDVIIDNFKAANRLAVEELIIGGGCEYNSNESKSPGGCIDMTTLDQTNLRFGFVRNDDLGCSLFVGSKNELPGCYVQFETLTGPRIVSGKSF